jgi:hypothetical membrane protein
MKSKILITRAFVIAGGLLLIVGAVMPWLTLTNDNPFPGFPAVCTGLQGNESYNGNTLLGGLILVLIGIFRKDEPGKSFSMFGVIVSVLCGLVILQVNLTYVFYLFSIAEDGGHGSFGIGLTRLSPLGALLGLIGSLLKTPEEPTSAAGMPATPLTSASTDTSKKQDFAIKPRRFLIAGGILLMASVVISWITVTNNDPFFSRSSGITSRSLGLSLWGGIFLLLGSLILVLIGIFKKGKPGESFSIFAAFVSSLCGLRFIRLIWYYDNFIAPFSGATAREGEHILLLMFIALDLLLGLVGALLGLAGSTMKTPM